MKILESKLTLKNIFLLIASALLLSNCSTSKLEKGISNKTTPKNQILEKYWKLIELNGKAVKMSASQEREAYMILKRDSSKVKGFDGCNYFVGNYHLMNNGKIKFINFAAGKKLCNQTSQKNVFVDMLSTVESFKTKQDTLWLSSKNKTVAKLEAVYF